MCLFRGELQEVLFLFQEAALLNLDSVDPDLQTGLGILYNLSSDFEKAVGAFSAALTVRPQVEPPNTHPSFLCSEIDRGLKLSVVFVRTTWIHKTFLV